MAEDEIIKKHTESVVNTWRDPQKKWLHKLKDIAQEVLIIVFAVSISIWFHSWAEDRKDHKQAVAFFAGLKEDLQADIHEMEDDRSALQRIGKSISYLMKSRNTNSINSDSLAADAYIFFSEAQINPRVGRYEALKSSGKLDIIEDKKLLYNITDLYQKTFPRIFRTNETYNALTTGQIAPFLGDVAQWNATGKCVNMPDILRSSKMMVLLMQLSGDCANSVSAYTDGIKQSYRILKALQ